MSEVEWDRGRVFFLFLYAGSVFHIPPTVMYHLEIKEDVPWNYSCNPIIQFNMEL